MHPLTLEAFQGTADHRGAMVMGFGQDKTEHHFRLFEDGGAIEVSVKDAPDAKNLDAIRLHLPHIAQMFGAGDFNAPMLVHDSAHVPGTATMAQLKNRIAYRYVETPRGGRVRRSADRRQTNIMSQGQLGPRELSQATGVSTDTLRHYERLNLLPGVRRSTAGYRRYPSGAAARRVRLGRGTRR